MQIRTTLMPGLSILLLGILLSACSPLPTQPERPPDPDIARAATLLAKGQFLPASTLYEALASRVGAPENLDFWLKAADSALQGGDLERTTSLLQHIADIPLSPAQQLYRRLLKAELELAQRQPDMALQTLLQALPADSPTDLRTRYLRDLANAYRQVGNLLESANTLVRLDKLLGAKHEERLQVQSGILRALTALNERTLQALQPSPPGTIGGWMELALLLKRYAAEPEALAPQLQAWRHRFPNHPALPELLQRFSKRLQTQIRKVDHIAILLPQQGRYAAAARALRDGIMASYYELPEAQRPLLRFYDSTDPANIWPLYSQAVASGAGAIIGPLQKKAVEQLLRAGELAVPVLALNQVNEDISPPDNFYMFALNPEHEAELAAEFIWQQGLRHPVMLTPETSWGQRLAAAFKRRWQAMTGEPTEGRTYNPESADYSQAISSLVHLDQSKARHARIQRWLGTRLEFEPRRRQDIDAVFVAAHPRQAQSIHPQLAFFRAGDLPMVTTSHAWNGSLSPQQLADMRGILLPDIPLVANQAEREKLGEILPGVLGPGVRLYAMGMDAFRLLPHLRRLQESPYEALDGQTGNLFMNQGHQIRRQLVWLSLDSPPRILGYSARMDLDQTPQQLQETPAAPAQAPEEHLENGTSSSQ